MFVAMVTVVSSCPGSLTRSHQEVLLPRSESGQQRNPEKPFPDGGGDLLECWHGPASDVSGGPRVGSHLTPVQADLNRSSSDFYGNADGFPPAVLRLPAAEPLVAVLHAFLRYTLGN